jgi:tRNA(Ile)-lysidine synthase
VGGTVAVAYSGGRDSLALLHATCRAAQALGLRVVAFHVHHGLLADADGWLRRAQQLCARWRRRGWPVALIWRRLDGQPAPGDSIEAWARSGRHAALAAMAKEAGATLLLLAHHRRDQAETFVLQALRGGAPAGLSAMPRTIDRDGLTWARPWLDQPRAAIDAYVAEHRLRPVEDPSNADARMARNRLRLLVWPALEQAFPHAETSLAAAAARAQEARAALDELAALDLAPLVDAAGGLAVAGWRVLSAARQANALRAWWTAQTGHSAPMNLVTRLLREVPARGVGRWPAGGGWQCVLRRGRLAVQSPVPAGAAGLRADTGASGASGPVEPPG